MPTNKTNKRKHSVFNSSCLITALLLTYLFTVQTACKKLIEIPAPVASIADDNVFTSDATATAVLTGIYTSMSTSGTFSGSFSISFFTGLSSDELSLNNGATIETFLKHYRNELAETGIISAGSEHWALLYNYIFKCNAVIEGLSGSKSLTPTVKQQLMGEAKFMRAFFYFYLVNLFGDVPLALTTDYKINGLLPRTPKTIVYQQMIADLKESQQLLSNGYLDATLLKNTTERVRPSKWSATALLSRVYLFMGDYINAETQASSVINNTGLFELPVLNNIFLKNSTEAIWQIQPTIAGFNTYDAIAFVLAPNGPSSGPDRAAYLSPQLLNSFEFGDARKVIGNWIDSIRISGITYFYPFKYKIYLENSLVTSPKDLTEYLMVLRLGEQYLIRAEARAQQNNINGSQSDLNNIRGRAGLANTTATDKSSLLAAILHERQVELFTEFGHRWLDLKRTGNVDAVMSVVTPSKANGAAWQSYQQLYPLPLKELQSATNLVQNSGY